MEEEGEEETERREIRNCSQSRSYGAGWRRGCEAGLIPEAKDQLDGVPSSPSWCSLR